MTEVEWQSGQAPDLMLGLVQPQASSRKLQLFAVACCRAIWPFLHDPRGRTAVEVLERFADGKAGEAALADAVDEAGLAVSDAEAALEDAWHGYHAEVSGVECPCGACAALWADRMDELNPRNDPNFGYQLLERQVAGEKACAAARLAHQAANDYRTFPQRVPRTVRRGQTTLPIDQGRLLHELFGNPFRLPAIAADWRRWEGGTVMRLAQTIYEEKAFGDLPILADALEEAGCADVLLLGHLRQPGAHGRGCWAVDALLGRE